MIMWPEWNTIHFSTQLLMPQHWHRKKGGDLMLITKLVDTKLDTQEDQTIGEALPLMFFQSA